MSLIEEALRRLKDPAIPKTSQEAPPKPPPAHQTPVIHSWQEPLPSTAPPAAFSPTPFILIGVAVTVLGLAALLLVGGALWLTRAMHPANKTQATSPVGTTPAPSGSKPYPELGRQPVLSGIVEGAGGSYAMLNGNVVIVGDRVGDAALVEIANGSVTLRSPDGEDTVLHLKR